MIRVWGEEGRRLRSADFGVEFGPLVFDALCAARTMTRWRAQDSVSSVSVRLSSSAELVGEG